MTNSLTQLLSYPLLLLAVDQAMTPVADRGRSGRLSRCLIVAALIGVKGPIGIIVAVAFAVQIFVETFREHGKGIRDLLELCVAVLLSYGCFFGVGILSRDPITYRPHLGAFGFLTHSEFVVDGRIAVWAGVIGLIPLCVVVVTAARVTAMAHVMSTARVDVWFTIVGALCIVAYVAIVEVAPPVTISAYFLLHLALVTHLALLYNPLATRILDAARIGPLLSVVGTGVLAAILVARVGDAPTAAAQIGRILRASGALWQIGVAATIIVVFARLRRHARRRYRGRPLAVVPTLGVLLVLLSCGSMMYSRFEDLTQEHVTPVHPPRALEATLRNFFATTDPRRTIIATNRVCEPEELECNPGGDPLVAFASRRQMFLEGPGHITTAQREGPIAAWVSARIELSRRTISGGGPDECRALRAAGVTHYVADLRVTAKPQPAPCLERRIREGDIEIYAVS